MKKRLLSPFIMYSIQQFCLLGCRQMTDKDVCIRAGAVSTGGLLYKRRTSHGMAVEDDGRE